MERGSDTGKSSSSGGVEAPNGGGNTMSKEKRSKGRKKKAGIVGLLAATVAGLAIWRVLECGGLGKGKGTGKTGTRTEATEPRKARPNPMKRPLEVVVDGDRYQIGGKDVTIEQAIDLARKVTEGPGPAVSILLKGSSRARAEKRIATAFKAAKIDYVMRDQK